MGDGFDQNLFFFVQAFFGKNTGDHNHRIALAGSNEAVSVNRLVGNDSFVADSFDKKKSRFSWVQNALLSFLSWFDV